MQRRLAVAGQLRGKQRTLLAAVPVAAIRANPDQPRKTFDPGRLAELAASIRERGLLQPVIVKQEPAGGYLLMAGERRLRAAELAGVDTLPALVREDDPLEVGLIENLQREDLSPLEEAEALALLAERQGYTHQALADLLGKSRPYVSNTLTLTRLPRTIKEEVLASGTDVSRELLIAVARQPSEEAAAALWLRVKLAELSVRRYREGPAPAVAADPPRSTAAEVLTAARRFGRVLRRLDWTLVEEAERDQLRRALVRLGRRVTRTLALTQAS
jgi:ParB family chromosome partitioning protein